MFVRLRFQAATLRLNKPLRQFSSIANADVKPIEIKLKKQEKALYIKFNDNCSFRYPAEYLRVESPSAEVQGHGTTQGKRVTCFKLLFHDVDYCREKIHWHNWN